MAGSTHDLVIPGTPYAALIGRIEGKQFLIGRGAKINVEQDGVLEMRINDKGVFDNDGELTMTIIQKDN